MTPALTPDERETARTIWEQLHRGDSETFENAPESIRAAIFEASKTALQNCDEPDTANPFDEPLAAILGACNSDEPRLIDVNSKDPLDWENMEAIDPDSL